MFIKLRQGLYYNLLSLSSFELHDDYMTFYLNCCDSKGDLIYESIYFGSKEEYETAKITLLEAINN